LAAGHGIAFLGQQFGDRQTVDLGPDHDFIAGNQCAGQQDRFGERAGRGAGDADAGRFGGGNRGGVGSPGFVG
jgi:hypothetical protein